MTRFLVAWLVTNMIMVLLASIIIGVKLGLHVVDTSDMHYIARFETYCAQRHPWWHTSKNRFVVIIKTLLVGSIASCFLINDYYDFVDYENQLTIEEGD